MFEINDPYFCEFDWKSLNNSAIAALKGQSPFLRFLAVLDFKMQQLGFKQFIIVMYLHEIYPTIHYMSKYDFAFRF